MSFQLDAKFFRRAKKVNRAVEITDMHAFIPAIKDSPEIRVALPNRRPKTMEERQTAIDIRYEQIAELEEEIEVERKQLIELTKTYSSTKSGAADVVVQNLKVQALMEKRKALQYPEIWIETVSGVTLKDIFESKRDTRKVDGGVVQQISHRVEPITSLYVDLAAPAAGQAEQSAVAAVDEDIELTVPKTAADIKEQAKVGSIIQKKVLKLKKTMPMA